MHGLSLLFRNHRAEMAALGALVLVTLGVLPLVEAGLDRATAALKVEAVAALEQAVDRDIQYRSISPSVLLYLEVRDLRLVPRTDDALPAVRISRLRVYYSIFRLLRGGSPLEAVKRVDVRDTSFDLGSLAAVDVAADPSAGPRPGALASLKTALEALPRSLEVTGTNLSVSLTVEGTSVNVRRLFLKARRAGDQISLQVTRASIEASGADFGFRTQSRLTARVSPDLAKIDAMLRVDSFRSESLALSRQSFQIQRESGSVDVRRVRDKAPIDFRLTIDPAKARVTVKTQAYNPRTLVSFQGPLAFLNQYTKASITTNSAVEYSLSDGSLRYLVALDAEVGGRVLPTGTVVEARIEGDERAMHFAPLAVTSSRGGLRFEGDLMLSDLLPEGLLSLTNLTTFAGKRVDADLDLKRNERSVVLSGNRFEIAGTTFERLRLTLTPTPREMLFALEAGVGRGASTLPALTATGSLRTQPRAALTVSLLARSVPLSLVARLAPLTDASLAVVEPGLSNLSMDGDFTLETDFRSVRLAGQDLAVTDLADPRNAVSFSLQYSDRELRANDISAAWRGHFADGSVRLRGGPGSTAFDGSLVVDRQPYAFDGSWDSLMGLRVTGSHGLRISAQPVDGSYAVTVAATGLPLPLRGGSKPPAWLDIDADATWGGPRFWSIDVSRFALSGLPPSAGGAGRIEAKFAASPRLVRLERLSFRDDLGEIANARPVTFTLRETLSGSLDLVSASGPERYALVLDLGSTSFDAEARIVESPLARLVPGTLTGNFGGVIRASGAYDAPAVRASLQLSRAAVKGSAVSASLEAAYSKGRIAITSLDSATGPVTLGPTLASYETASGAFELETSLSERTRTSAISARLSLSGRLQRDPGVSLWGALFRGQLKGQAAVTDMQPHGDIPESWILAFSKAGDRIAFDGGPADSIRGYVSEAGAFDLVLVQPLPIRGHAAGLFMTDSPEAVIGGLEIDMAWLSSLARSSFSFTRGTAYGIGDIALDGSLADPEWRGKIEARGVQMGYYMSPELTSPFRADITLQGRDLVLAETRAPVGDGDLVADGVIGFSHWSPSNYDLRFRTTKVPGLHMVQDFGSVFVDGYAMGSVQVKGDDLAVRVTGDLEVDYCKLTLSDSSSTRKAAGSDRTVAFVDLRLTAGRRVEFVWPSVAFPVLRATARTGSGIRIEHAGDVQQTSVVGRVLLRGGDVFYINRSFYIKAGELAFNESAQRFDPRLTLRGEIRERDRAGEDVKIYLVVDDKRLSEFAPRFESDPPRSAVEIVALLGGPIEDQLVQSGLAGSAVLVSSDIISHFGLLRPFEQGVRDLLRLDLFSIRTQMIQNVVVDRVLGIEQPVAKLSTDPLGRYFDNTTVTFGKYLGRDLFLEMDVRMTENEVSGVDTEVQFSLDWPTPLFDLEWVVSPGGGDIESFVREKTQLSLTWRHSY